MIEIEIPGHVHSTNMKMKRMIYIGQFKIRTKKVFLFISRFLHDINIKLSHSWGRKNNSEFGSIKQLKSQKRNEAVKDDLRILDKS